MNRHILRNIMTSSLPINSVAITYSRILENDKINIKSLDMQERCIKKWLDTKNIGIFENIKEIDYNNLQNS
jgi:hypothetical protein